MNICTWCSKGVRKGTMQLDAAGTEHFFHKDCLRKFRNWFYPARKRGYKSGLK